MSIRPRSISNYLAVVLLTVITLILLAYCYVDYINARAHHMSHLREQLKVTAVQVTTGLEVPLGNRDHRQVDTFLDGIMADPTIAYIDVTGADTVFQRGRNDKWEVIGRALPMTEPVLEIQQPITYSGKKVGAVRIGLTTRYVKEELVNGAVTTLVLILFLDAATCGILYLILSRKLLSPLEQLNEFAGSVIRGEPQEAAVSEAPLLDELENLRSSLVTMVEVLSTRMEEQKKAEEELRRNRNMLSTIVDTIPQAVFWKDRAYRYLGCNRRFAADAGVGSPEEIVGKTDLDLWWLPEDVATYRTDDREVMSQNRSKLHIIEPLQKGTTRAWLDTSKLPLVDGSGRVYAVLGVYEDITERKRSEEELKAEKERAELYLEIVEVVLVALDIKGQVTMLNRKGYEVLGYREGELLGKDWFMHCVPADDYDDASSMFERVLSGRHAEYSENRIVTKSGEQRLIAWHNTLLRNAAGTVIGTLSSGEDITSRKLLEEQLHHSQKMESIGRLAGGVAHDFNNMLSVIIGAASLAQGLTPTDDPITTLLAQILKAAERSSTITRQLLAFSRKQVTAPKPINLNALLLESEKVLSRLISEDIKLTFQPSLGLWTVLIDPSQVDQILMNLCVNARDAMPHGGTLTMHTGNTHIDEGYTHTHIDARPGDYVMLTVSDTGIGMTREVQEHIFEPFFTTKPIGEGTGLGLATVYGIVTQNNGFINVYSELGQGTVFRIYLPRYLADAKAPESQGRIPLEGTGTILLVEDEEMLLWTTTKMLEQIGYTVIQAATPEEAIAICSTAEPVDLILTDVVMPGMNGREMVDEVKKIRRGVKVLFMSGYTAEIVAKRGVVEEGMHYIQKPLDLRSLHEKIRSLIHPR
ncbi:hybrid sensor histidine kinase/response regulator [Geomesophilobacter sediminis]|uniref:histidine kinase n=1 Tax=Geomesophilobacter sediminis TaxID=2798584 RepID=A0A8J7M1A0_9BACT|nr:PAS domain S-box protein [Geomesophilobacter sediminis]MBJ6726784.1 PAS domain S-box protein [Geomesophilobacter sediminis]